MSRSDPYDDDDDRPRRRRDRDDDDDDYPRRSSRRRDDDFDDMDDYPRRPAAAGDGMGTAAMVVGIVGAVCTIGCCIPYAGIVLGPIGFICAVVAIILGFIARGQSPGSGKALAGIITGFSSILIVVTVVVLAFALGFGMAMMNPR